MNRLMIRPFQLCSFQSISKTALDLDSGVIYMPLERMSTMSSLSSLLIAMLGVKRMNEPPYHLKE